MRVDRVNKQELAAMVAEILSSMDREPMVKGEHPPANPGPERKESHFQDGDFVPDVTQLDLRKLYLVQEPEDGEKFQKLKEF